MTDRALPLRRATDRRWRGTSRRARRFVRNPWALNAWGRDTWERDTWERDTWERDTWERGAWALRGLVGVALAAALAPGALADPLTGQQFTTATGHQLDLPPIDDLDCAEMRALLKRIDNTNYRGLSPQPGSAADMPLFKYENALAAAHYRACARQPDGAPPARIFQFRSN